MKIPKQLKPLVADDVVHEVLRQLKGGKEATVYLVRCGEELRCAKVYKEAKNRSFRHAADYLEGRKVKGSRRARAMKKGSAYGRKEEESAWQTTEVNVLYHLAAHGVKVAKPRGFYDGVLLMDVITDEHGNPAPRLNDMILDAELAREYHSFLIRQVVLMLCAGIIHGDLSEYNVLVGSEGPVIIDVPQAINAAENNNASRMLERDVLNLAEYFGQFSPELATTEYGKEIWQLYKDGKLTPDSPLTGKVRESSKPVDISGVMQVVNDVLFEEEERRRNK